MVHPPVPPAPTTLAELSRALPPPRREPEARERIREHLRGRRERIAVIDDDPTGTQTARDARVWLRWTPQAMRAAVADESRLSFVSVNTRALNAGEAVGRCVTVGRNLGRAAARAGERLEVISRSDSTLRGHFPLEVEALARGLGTPPDAIIVAPSFFEGGRYTAGDVQWVEQAGRLVAAAQTEFARDPVFGYGSSDLRSWVEEKSGGRVRAADVRSVSLEAIRAGGPREVARLLMNAPRGSTVVANALAYEDLEVFVLGMLEAEDAGRRFLCRTAASFVKARAGIPDRPLLGAREIGVRGGPVLVAVGSWVDKSTRQLARAVDAGLAQAVELHVDALGTRGGRAREIAETTGTVVTLLRGGRSVALHTSRARRAGGDFLRFGSGVMAALVEVVRRLPERPSAVIAKGGITSIEIARSALGARDAVVAGQVLGGVPVWRLGAGSRFPGMPYVVFPGNVGDDEALARVLQILQGTA